MYTPNRLFKNNATAQLAVDLSETDTQVFIVLGQGQKFPSIASSLDFYNITIYKDKVANHFEIMKVINRIDDMLIVERGAENTTARSFLIGDRIDLRLTAGALEEFRDDYLRKFLIFPAGEVLGGNRVVHINNNNAFYASSSDLNQTINCQGITSHSAVIGEHVRIQIFGKMVEPSWDWDEGPLYLGEGGILQSVPGIITKQMAVALNKTHIFINPQIEIS